jgi:3-oxoacyl-[acyl-carrier protein] reductase
MMSKKLTGKVAIVTGASKGIGASIAIHLASEGAHVVVNYAKDKKGADQTVAEILHKGGKALAVQANMSHEAEIKHLFSESSKAFGKLDILVNNAGIYDFITLEETKAEHFHAMFDLNVLGPLLASREAVKHFGPSGGSIINISSIAATAATPHLAVYCATKAAVNALTRCLGTELGPRNIRVNGVAPGMVETPGTETKGILASEMRKEMESQTPLGRIGKPHDITPAVVFLASDDAAWITGETLYISGGFR